MLSNLIVPFSSLLRIYASSLEEESNFLNVPALSLVVINIPSPFSLKP